jgi:adenosylhomocysteine nucleosidase
LNNAAMLEPSTSQQKQNEPVLGMIAAFRWEVAPLLKKQRAVRQSGNACYRFSLNGAQVVLAISGAGAENAYRASRELAARYPVRSLLAVGFAAGLIDSLEPGELVLADRVIEEGSQKQFPCQRDFLGGSLGRYGTLLCVSDVLTLAQEKRHLAERWGAIAADMESAGVARAAAEAGVAFGAVRSITDGSDQSIAIDFRRCRSEHEMLSPWKIVREGISSSRGLRDLWWLASNSRRAAGNLALGLSAVAGIGA